MGFQDASKTSQDGAKMGQDGAKTAQDSAKTDQAGAKTAQDSAKTRPRRFQNAILGILELSWEGFGRPRRAQDGPRWRASETRERAKRAKRAERQHAVPSRPRRCDRTTIEKEIQENKETGRAEDHMF